MGGTTSTGGTTATGGSSGNGCTGSYEIVQSSMGLCVAKMVTITAPSGYSNYSIDATEVTKGQYDAWLATSPSLPASTDKNCGWKSTGSYAEQDMGYTGTDAGHHPVTDVDWCDAYAYCAGVGKRLCGAIGGGSNAYASYADASTSQWYRACSSAGTHTYPYGSTFQSTYCNGSDYGAGTTVEVGTLTNCQSSVSGYTGVYDLSGNVWEWEDSCYSTGVSANCRFRGGSLGYSSDVLTCGNGNSFGGRNNAYGSVGFRCCSS